MKRFVEIDTPLEPDTLLFHRLRATEELSRLSNYDLDLLSSDRAVKLDDVLGKSVTVKLELSEDKTRTFSGYVTRIAQVGMHGRYYAYRATVRPWLWFLTRTTNCRIFQDKSVPDILKEVFALHPAVADVKFELTESYSPWDYCVQYRETDFNFVSRLMEHEGMYYFFKHSEGRHTLVVADSYSAHAVANGGEIPFIDEEKLVRREREHVSDWSITHELQPGKYMLTDYDFEKPSVDLQVKSTIKREHAMAEYELYDYPGDYLERGDGELYVRTRIEEVQAKFERVQGTTNARALATGYLFTLTSHPRDDQNTEYLVVSAEYELKSNEYESSDATGADYQCRFVALNSHQPFRPERITPKPIVQGPQTAITVGPPGEDIYTDKFGRVKVQFHWDRYGKKDDKSSCWIRVSQNWGGKGWGGMFIPHVKQEVIVQFLEGDPDNPLITGRVYNAENMPPVELPAGKTQSIIRDHGGNEIKMEGNGGGQQIKMFSPTGNTTLAIGAPGSPGDGIEGLTDLFFKMSVGKDWKELVKGNKEEEIQQDKSTLIVGNTNELFKGTKREVIHGMHSEWKLGMHHETVGGFKLENFLGAIVSNKGGANIENSVGLVVNNTFAAQIDVNKGPRAESYPSAFRRSKAFIKETAQALAFVTELSRQEAKMTKVIGKTMSSEMSGKMTVTAPKIEEKASGKIHLETATLKADAKCLLDGKMCQKGGKASLAGGSLKCSE